MTIEDRMTENLQFKKNCVLNFDNKSDLDIPVYRVYPIDRLIQLFNQKKNTLVKPRMWDDPFENLVFQQTAKTKSGEEVHFDNIQESLYGQCWTLNTIETDALWRIYSPAKNGVRVKTTINKLWDGFYDASHTWATISFFIGKIIYASESEIQKYFEDPNNLREIFGSSAKGVVNTVLIKREEFRHENEVCLVFRANANEFDITKITYQYDFDPMTMFDELLFDPRFDKGIFEVMKTVLSQRGFSRLIAKSRLYQAPKFDMRLDF